jgi:trehalose 6-phosphate phosphatase
VKHILAPAQRELLLQLSWSNVLLGFDFDGTLAPIVADPARAELRAGTRKLLLELVGLYPCAVISGRSVRDVQRRVAGIAFRAVVGNHGLEPWRATEEIRGAVDRWKLTLAPALAGLQGVELEDKTYSLALHYRRARAKKSALAAILREVGRLGDVRVIGGKQVLNVVPLDAPHKGLALERERDRSGCDTAFFLGDDETDEDVFAMGRPGRLFSVRVGVVPDSHAAYCLKSQREVDDLLARLISLRKDAPGLRLLAR